MAVLVAAVALPLAFSLYCNHVWEDFFITYRHSKNLALGLGFTYNPGQLVHGFTSPLGTLIPALLCLLTRNSSDLLVIWLFRLITVGFLAMGMVRVLQICRHAALSRWAIFLALACLLLDAKILEFSTDGMETGILLFFLADAVWQMLREGPQRGWRVGLAWAGLMWTRPDSFVYIIALSGAFLAFSPDSTVRRRLLGDLGRAAGLSLVLYLPWVLWAWWYYGSPIPHTIIAKQRNDTLAEVLYRLFFFPLRCFERGGAFSGLFMPPNYLFGGWPFFMVVVSRILALVGCLYFLRPRGLPLGRALSLAFFLGCVYVDYTGKFPWYYASITFLGVLVLAHVWEDARVSLQRVSPGSRPAAGFAWLLGIPLGLLILFQACTCVAVAYQLQIQQTVVENGNRTQIGLWLKNHARPTDTVFVECLGYIGYYSGLKFYDCPGLTSPEMVAARRRSRDNWALALDLLRPDWLVLRPREYLGFREVAPPELVRSYVPVKDFDVSSEILAYPYLPGINWLLFDSHFTVFRRVPPAPVEAGSVPVRPAGPGSSASGRP